MNVYIALGLMVAGIGMFVIGVRGMSAVRSGWPREISRRGGTATAWVAAACTCATTASFVLAVMPINTTESEDSGGHVVPTHQTLAAAEGAGALLLLALPIAVTAVAAIVPRAGVRVVLAAVLDTGCFLALASVGIFYVPAAIGLTVAATLTPRQSPSISAEARR